MQRFFSLLSALILITMCALIVYQFDAEQVNLGNMIELEDVEFEDNQDEELEEIQFEPREFNSYESLLFCSDYFFKKGFNYQFTIKSFTRSIHSPPPEV